MGFNFQLGGSQPLMIQFTVIPEPNVFVSAIFYVSLCLSLPLSPSVFIYLSPVTPTSLLVFLCFHPPL